MSVKKTTKRELPEIRNKKATFNYKIEETYEAGIELLGHEVKSIRLKKCDITGCYVMITKYMEAFLIGMVVQDYSKISGFTQANAKGRRKHRLLLKKREIAKIHGKTHKTTKTVTALRVFFNGRNLIKAEIAIASPMKLFDKRQKLKEQDIARSNDIKVKTPSSQSNYADKYSD